MRQPSMQAEVMARALIQQGHLAICDGSMERPHHANTTVFPIPKNSEKAGLIVHYILVNEKTGPV